MPKYSGFDPIESHNVVTTSSTTTGIEHTGRGDTVLYLPFDDDVNDDSLFNQTITNRAYNGNPITVDSSYSKFGGKSLRSWLRSSLKIDNSSSMDLNTPFTVEFFFRNSTQLSNVALYTHNEINSSYSGLLFWIANDNTLRLYGSSTGGSWNIFQNPTTMATISANVWHHVAITFDGSTYRGYYDGNIRWQRNTSTTLPTGGHSYILSRSDAGSYQAGTDHVRIDDFRITKGVALYTDSTYTVPTSALGLHNGDPVSLYLPFDSDIQDDSTFGHTVTAAGSAAISSTQTKFGSNSLFLDASGDFLTIPGHEGFNFGTSDFTIEMFIRPDTINTSASTGAYAAILDNDASTLNGAHFTLHQNNQTLVWVVQSSIGLTTSNCLSANTWHHVVVVRAGDTTTIYCDGINVGSFTDSQNYNDSATRTFYIGKQNKGGVTRRFDGYIDDLRITKGVARYTKNFIPPNAAVGATLNGKNETNTTTDFTSLYLPFDSDLNDDSSYGHTVTASGDAAISSTQAKFGGNSLALDGTGDYLTIPSNDAFHYGDGDFTIEMFVYMSSNSSSSDPMNLISKWDDGQRSWAFELENNNKPRIRFSYDGSSKNVDTTLGTDVAPSSGQWHHLAFVRSGATLTAYLDGVAGSTTINLGTSSLASPTSSVYIGQRGSQRYFNGYLDDIRILKGHAKYTADFTPPTSAVGTSVSETVNDLTLLYMPFDGTESTTSLSPASQTELYAPFDSDLNDDSSNAYAGTSGNGAAISSTQSKFGGYSLALDGTNDYVRYASSSLALGTDDFTIEAFIYDTKADSSYREIVNNYNRNNNSGIPFLFRMKNATGQISFSYYTGSWTHIVTSSSVISPNTWHHVAAVRSGNNLTIYVDGVSQVTSNISSFNNTNAQPIEIGAYSSGYSSHFGGYIDDVRIIKGTAIYTSNFTVPITALGVAGSVTSLKGGFEDLARNHSVTKAGDASLQGVKKFGTSSMYFPAATDYIEIPGGQFDFASSDFTIEGWFYDSGSGSSRNVALDYRLSGGGGAGSGSETFGFFFYLKESGNGKFYIGLEDDAGTLGLWPMFNSSSLAISPNTWTHYAFTREGSTFRAFKDGSLIATQSGVASEVGSSGGNAILRIGGGHDSGHGMAGYIDDLRIIKGKAVYTEAFTPPSSALGTELSDASTTVTTETKVLSSTWTMTNDGSSARSFIDMRSDNTWANNEHLQTQSSHRWNPANLPGAAPDTVATGGTIATPGNGYRYHVFTSPGTFELTSIDGGAPTLAVEYLIVAGGGGGGGDRAGGAGAGGLKTNEDGNPKAAAAMNLSTGTTNVVVGAGGAGADAPQTPAPYQNPSPLAYAYNGRRGYASSFGSIESRGGGGGGGPMSSNPEGPGGSGGGGGSSNPYLSGYAGNIPPTTPIPQGNPGGNGSHTSYGGGGGGAGAAGSAINAGNGHAVPSFSGPILAPAIPAAMATAIGPTGIYAGGGGGGAGEGTPTGAGNAGTGGGGAGGARSIPPSSYNPNSNEYGPAGAPGVDGTGGGGGGAGNFPGTNSNMRPGGDGGNGIVIIKYAY